MLLTRYGSLMVIASFLVGMVHGQQAGHELAADSVFGLENVWEVHIQFEAEQWEAIQPPNDTNWDVEDALEGVIRDAIKGGHFHSENSTRPGLAGYMGVDHQYGRATVVIGEDKIADVGVRYKGNGTFLTGYSTGKYPFKVDFNEYVDDQQWRGLTKINLSNCAADPSMLRDPLAYELFREANVPAPRTAWAKVFLTVANKYDRKYQGLYEVVEQIDKRFLKDRFGNAKGLLIKPSTFGAFRYLGEDWSAYEEAYFPKTEGTPKQRQHFIDFARLVNRSSTSEFNEHVEEFLDIDQFLNFLAVNVVLCNLDSFLGASQNYYAYLNPETSRIQMLPWDLDHSFGAFELIGYPASRRNLSINHPQVSDHLVIKRILANPEYLQRYRKRIEELLDTVFAEEKLQTRIQHAGDFVRPLVALEGEAAVERFEATLADEGHNSLPAFVTARTVSIRQQLAGESDGERLTYSEIPPRLAATLIGVAIAIAFALVVNGIAWVWGVFVGSKKSWRWAVANTCLYPVAPIVQGLRTRKRQDRRMACLVAAAFIILVIVIFSAIVALR